MDRYATGSPEIIVQRMGEFLVPKYFGAVELDSSTATKFALLYADSEKTNLAMKIPVGATSGLLTVYGTGGSTVASVNGTYGIPSSAFFHVSERAVVVASYIGTNLQSNSSCVWLFAKDAKNTTVAIKYATGSGAGINVFLPGVQINTSYSQTFLYGPQYITNAFCTILVPAFSVDSGYAENIEGVYVLTTANNFPREGVGVLSLNGELYDILACWAIKRQ